MVIDLADFTQEQVNEMIKKEKEKWIKEELKPLQDKEKEYKATIDELMKYKPKELTKEEKALQEKELELFNKEKNLILKENGLAEFGEFFNVQKIDELDEKIKQFNDILKEKKIDNSYKPDDKHKNTDKYSQFEKNKDTVGMISTKLSKLFK